MQPAGISEDEFNDWYDLEHIPQRLDTPGFVSAERFIRIDGWPKYVAVYDLEHKGVTTSPDYRATAGANFSPWTKRVLSNAAGWGRLDLEQVSPGQTVGRSDWRGAAFIQLGATEPKELIRLAQSLSGSGQLQVRAFRGTAMREPASLLMLEAPTWRLLPTWTPAELGELLGPLTGDVGSVDYCTKYWRADPLALLQSPKRSR